MALNIELPDSDVRKLDKAGSSIMESEQISREARNIYNYSDPSSFSKAERELKSAVFIQKMAVMTFREIYNEHIKEFIDGINAIYRDNLGRGKHFHEKAKEYFGIAADKRDSLERTEDFMERYNLLLQVYEYEKLGIINLARTLRVYQDWPIEYDYEWDDYIKPLDPLIAEDRRRDSIASFKKSSLTSRDSSVVFKAQIAAHTIEMSEEYLRTNIYKGVRQINKFSHDGWYTYNIGTFFTYEEATRIVKLSGVDKAFVAAYKDGKRIKIAEARRLTSNK